MRNQYGFFSPKYFFNILSSNESHSNKGIPFCVWERANGEYAIITSVADKNEFNLFPETPVHFYGPVTKCLINHSGKVAKNVKIDFNKLKAAYEFVSFYQGVGEKIKPYLQSWYLNQ